MDLSRWVSLSLWGGWRISFAGGDGDLVGDGGFEVDLMVVCRFFKGVGVKDSEMESCFRLVLDLVDRGRDASIVASLLI